MGSGAIGPDRRLAKQRRTGREQIISGRILTAPNSLPPTNPLPAEGRGEGIKVHMAASAVGQVYASRQHAVAGRYTRISAELLTTGSLPLNFEPRQGRGRSTAPGQGCEAGGPGDPAVDEIRADYQPQDG